MKKIVIISGPTASGKSQLALQIAAFKDIAIINADALQLYQGLPILSAQPNDVEKNIAPHFLYSHFLYNQSCSVATWLKLVKSTVEGVMQQGKLPIIVGGSGMYISKLIDGISIIPEIDEAFRIEARELYQKISKQEFITNLIALNKKFDSENYLNNELIAKIQNLDAQRLIRAYEVLIQTKKSIFWWQNQEPKKIFDPQMFLHINLNLPREKIYENCNLRFQNMIENGAIQEVETLVNKGVENNCQITKTLGFAEIKSFLRQEINKEKMLEISAQKTRNYAKRQMTWFRHQFANKNVFENANDALNFLKNNT